MARQLYGDLLSQPTRAVLIFCKCNHIDIEFVPILIHKQQQKSKEFGNIYPLKKIPVFQEGDLLLPEAAAMLSYLVSTQHVSDHWYPDEPKARARVDAALHWHHSNVRKGAAPLVMFRVIAKNIGVPPNDRLADESEALLMASLKALERYWLKGRKFVAGDEISIADLLMTTEIDQLEMLISASKGPTLDELLKSLPLVRSWMQRVKESCEPHYQEVSALLQKAVEKRKQLKNQAKL